MLSLRLSIISYFLYETKNLQHITLFVCMLIYYLKRKFSSLELNTFTYGFGMLYMIIKIFVMSIFYYITLHI